MTTDNTARLFSASLALVALVIFAAVILPRLLAFAEQVAARVQAVGL